MTMNEVLNKAKFSFVKGGKDVYFVEKDKHNLFYPFVAVTEDVVNECMSSPYETIIRNQEGEILMKNFDNEEKKYDLKLAQEVLSEIENKVNKKKELLKKIDEALDRFDKEEFMKLTKELEQLQEVS